MTAVAAPISGTLGGFAVVAVERYPPDEFIPGLAFSHTKWRGFVVKRQKDGNLL